jgi:hypothetical protein
MSDRSLMLFAGNANRALAQEIANYLKVPLGQASPAAPPGRSSGSPYPPRA